MNFFRAVILILCALAWARLPQATEWVATQGDVVTVEIDFPSEAIKLRCLNKSWPVRQLDDGRWRGWIGIDLKQKPGNYAVIWKSGSVSMGNDSIAINKGEFRISRITVKKNMAVFDKNALARIRKDARLIRAAYGKKVNAAPDIVMHGRPVEGIVSTPFGAQRFVNGEPRSPHSGMDIAAPAGTPVQAPLGGRVLLVGKMMYLNGNTVVVGHGNGLVSVFSHMQSVAVRQGEWVASSQLIGKVGATGRATGPHLHWGVRFNMARINPESLLK
jgi:murein DD-endopeptidase MepM/ murein hydrolase activator NlpD